jgi:transposase-like protein
MTVNLAHSVVPTTEICPNCKSEMAITQVTPILLVDGFEGVTYRCKGCRSEVKRTFKRQSSAWERVTLPSFFSTSSMRQKRKAQLAASCSAA